MAFMKEFLEQLQPSDFIQIVIGSFTLIAIIVSIIIFVKQRSADRKREAIKVGLSIEQLVVRWAYIDMVIYNLNKDVYKILENADSSAMVKFESNEIKNVYSEDEIKRIKTIFVNNYFNPRLKSSPSIAFNIPMDILKDANNLYPLVFNDVLGGRMVDSIHSFHRVVLNTLNQMETLCLMMDKKIADEDTVFEVSGFQFIQFVKIMYYYIAFVNNSDRLAKDGYYSKSMKYVIKTFRKWVFRDGRI